MILRFAQAVTNGARSNQHNFSDELNQRQHNDGILYSRMWRHEITKTDTISP